MSVYSFYEEFLPSSLVGVDIAKIETRFLLTKDGLVFERINEDWFHCEKISEAVDISASEGHIVIATKNGVYCRGSNSHGQSGYVVGNFDDVIIRKNPFHPIIRHCCWYF